MDQICSTHSLPQEEADQITRDLLLIFGGPEPLQRGYLKPEEVDRNFWMKMDMFHSLHDFVEVWATDQRERGFAPGFSLMCLSILVHCLDFCSGKPDLGLGQ